LKTNTENTLSNHFHRQIYFIAISRSFASILTLEISHDYVMLFFQIQTGTKMICGFIYPLHDDVSRANYYDIFIMKINNIGKILPIKNKKNN